MAHIKEEYLSDALPFWSALTNSQRENIIAGSRSERFKKDSLIYGGIGDLGVVIVRHGRLCVYTVSQEGREFVIMRLFGGSICMLGSETVMGRSAHITNISAESEVDLIIINSAVYDEICMMNRRAEFFTRTVINDHMAAIVANVQNMLLVSVERRVANFILEEHERSGSSRIKVTHEQLAKYIGTAREVVSRTLKKLTADGVISAERGFVVIKDPTALIKLI